MTTPARPGSFTGATDTASSGSYFGTTLLSGISDLVAADVSSAQTSATNAATSETNAATSATNSSNSATVAQQFATNPHNTQFTYDSSNYFSALHYATEVSSQTTQATNAKADAQKLAINPANTQFTLSDTTTGFSALHYQALANTNATSAATSATTSTNYATKIDGAITGSDYSSKAWAVGGTGVTTTSSRGAAKEWATTTGSAVDTSEYSAKEYAIGTTVPAGSAKEWATTAEDSAVSGGEFSAKHYAAKSAGSATVAASNASTASDHKDDAEAFKNTASYYATKIDGVVPSTSDYSAKAWAVGGTGIDNASGGGSAKDWATYTTNTVDNTEYSAKEYAIGTQSGQTAGSAKQWALGGGAGFNSNTAVAGGQYSAKYWAEQAAASADSFDDTYLGPKSSDPTVDNDGDALTTGDLYYNTGSNDLKVYNGSAWEVAAVSTASLPSAGFTIAMAIAL